jgi:hypothetical protein
MNSVMVVLHESFYLMEIRTSDPKFFVNTEFYFGKVSPVRSASPYILNGMSMEQEFKELGLFKAFKGYVSVKVKRSNMFDYTISLRFHQNGSKIKSLSKKSFFIRGFEVPQELLLFFDPGDIIWTQHFSPYEYGPQIEILVKNPDHPVLKYYENKALLSYGNMIYEHGKIPRPNSICQLTFVHEVQTGRDTVSDTAILYLTVNPQGESSENNYNNISFEVFAPEPEFFKVGAEILTKKELELRKINIESDYILHDTLFGKEAVDKFKDAIYSQGISVYNKKRR